MLYQFITGQGFNRSWDTWDEETEQGWGDEANTFICFFDAPNVGDDETGYGGGLSGSDLDVTQSGNVAGASGGYRTLDGTNDYFTFDQAVTDIISNNTTWTIFARIKTGTGNNLPFIEFYEGTNAQIDLKRHSDDTFRIVLDDSDNNQEVQTTTDTFSNSTEYYIFAACDGSNTKGGFHPVSSGRPTSWSELDSNKRVSFTNLYDNFGSFNTRRYIGYNTADYLDFGIQYVIISKNCFIDL